MAFQLPPSSLPNCSLSWTQNGRSEQQIQKNHNRHNASSPLASIDLHGYTQERAIRALTDFLETAARRSNHKQGRSSSSLSSFVQVITGTGSHSGAMGGPVLKQAVHKLLIKRDMEYSYTKQKGVFLVNVHSGHVLTASQNPSTMAAAASEATSSSSAVADEGSFVSQQDTKVRLVSRDHLVVATHGTKRGRASHYAQASGSQRVSEPSASTGSRNARAASSASPSVVHRSRSSFAMVT